MVGVHIAVLDDKGAVAIVENPDVPVAAGDRCQLTTLVVVIVGSRAVGSLGSQSVGIVGIGPGTLVTRRGWPPGG